MRKFNWGYAIRIGGLLGAITFMLSACAATPSVTNSAQEISSISDQDKDSGASQVFIDELIEDSSAEKESIRVGEGNLEVSEQQPVVNEPVIENPVLPTLPTIEAPVVVPAPSPDLNDIIEEITNDDKISSPLPTPVIDEEKSRPEETLFEKNCKKQSKIILCHKEKKHPITLCVPEEAVEAHKEHGDKLGACENFNPKTPNP